MAVNDSDEREEFAKKAPTTGHLQELLSHFPPPPPPSAGQIATFLAELEPHLDWMLKPPGAYSPFEKVACTGLSDGM
jgi:hypothetical protein